MKKKLQSKGIELILYSSNEENLSSPGRKSEKKAVEIGENPDFITPKDRKSRENKPELNLSGLKSEEKT